MLPFILSLLAFSPCLLAIFLPAESPPTAWPIAGEGLLPSVPPHVGLEVGRLGVELATAGVLTEEHLDIV